MTDQQTLYLVERGNESCMEALIAFDQLAHAKYYCKHYRPDDEDREKDQSKLRIRSLTLIKGEV